MMHPTPPKHNGVVLESKRTDRVTCSKTRAGRIPKEIGMLSSALREISLGGNEFSGESHIYSRGKGLFVASRAYIRDIDWCAADMGIGWN